MNKALTAAYKTLEENRFGLTLKSLVEYTETYHLSAINEKLKGIEADYELMKKFLLEGFHDEGREELLHRLWQRLLAALSELIRMDLFEENATFRENCKLCQDADIRIEEIEAHLSGFLQELAIISLDVEAEEKSKAIYIRQFEYRKQLFAYLFTSSALSEADSARLLQVLLSTQIDTIDAQLITSALMLANQFNFDIRKFRILCRLYSSTSDEEVRTRALVGIAFALPDNVMEYVYGDVVKETLKETFSAEASREELCMLLYQVIMSMETENTRSTIDSEIMPTLKKNAMEITEKDLGGALVTSSLEDILHPDKSEQEMETMENAIGKMRNMQDSGLDIFFGGFAQAKRFSFFYTFMNWFCPFYIEHPQLNLANIKNIPSVVLEKMVAQGFCSSDKYSFMLSLASVLTQLPQNIIDMLKSGEMAPAFQETEATPMLARRDYLQNLYRFYNLYTNKRDFSNPFSIFLENELFAEVLDDKELLSVSRHLLKHKRYREAQTFLDRVEKPQSASYLKLQALVFLNNNAPVKASHIFYIAYQLEPDNLKLLRLSADTLAKGDVDAEDKIARYEEYFGKTDSAPDECWHQYALVLMQVNRLDDASQILFRLYFEQEEKLDYVKSIVELYIHQGRMQEALSMIDKYDALQQDADIQTMKLLLCYAMNQADRIPEIIDKLKSACDGSRIVEMLDRCMPLFADYGIGNAECYILKDIINV